MAMTGLMWKCRILPKTYSADDDDNASFYTDNQVIKVLDITPPSNDDAGDPVHHILMGFEGAYVQCPLK